MRLKFVLLLTAIFACSAIAVQAAERVGLYLEGTKHQRGGEAIAQRTANLYVYDGCTVKAYDQSKIWAHDNCKVEAYGQTTVTAKANTDIKAFDTTRVLATNSAKIDANGSVDVIADQRVNANARIGIRFQDCQRAAAYQR